MLIDVFPFALYYVQQLIQTVLRFKLNLRL